MTRPKRIQWRHTDGPLPTGTKVVTRATRWGNPYTVAEYGRERAVDLYERDLSSGEVRFKRWRVTSADVRRELAGWDLACACRLGELCHADVLLRVANAEPCTGKPCTCILVYADELITELATAEPCPDCVAMAGANRKGDAA